MKRKLLAAAAQQLHHSMTVESNWWSLYKHRQEGAQEGMKEFQETQYVSVTW